MKKNNSLKNPLEKYYYSLNSEQYIEYTFCDLRIANKRVWFL